MLDDIGEKIDLIIERLGEIDRIASQFGSKKVDFNNINRTVFVVVYRNPEFHFIAEIQGVFNFEVDAIEFIEKNISENRNKENYDILPFKLI